MFTNDSVMSKLQAQVTESETGHSETGQQRERNHRYYTMQPLGNEIRGRSHYIDPTVHSSVEGKKAVFSETFLGAREVVRFSGSKVDGEDNAKTAYVRGVFKRNKYEQMFRDAWHDAFVSKRCTVWLDWREDTTTHEINFQGAPMAVVREKLQALGDIVEIDDSGAQIQTVPRITPRGIAQDRVVTGTLVVSVDDSYVEIDLKQPERVFRDPSQAYTEDAMWNACGEEVARGVLVEMGYMEEQVEKLDKDYRWRSQEEDHARRAHDRSYTRHRQYSRASEQEEVTFYKSRTWMSLEAGDIDGFEPQDDKMRLYEIHWAAGEVLRWADGTPAVREMDEMWVFEWTEIKVSHMDNGLCTADIEAHTQKTQSVLKRGIIDHMQITNNPRWEAVKENLHDARDLLDNHIGGVVWTDRLGSVAGLPTAQLSPLAFQTIQMLRQDSDERSGMSSLARGMNTDVVSHQNASDMIETQSRAGQKRVAMCARDFARTFLVPVMQCVVKIASKYDQGQDVMESAGKQVPIIPSQWQDEEHAMEIEVALTPADAEEQAKKLVFVHQLISQDEQAAPMYGAEQRHAFYDTLYDLIGIQDSTKYILPPTSPQYQQAMQQQAMQAQQAQEEQRKQIEFQMQAIADQSAQGWAKINNDTADKLEDNQRADAEFTHKREIDLAELEIERAQERPVGVG